MKKQFSSFVAIILMILFVSGCLPYKKAISDETSYNLVKPIDCSTAGEDIKVLESEKSSIQEQAKSGVGMVVPVAAARAILHGDYHSRKEVLSGEYNHDIDEKIKEIKSKCDLN
ncbi:MAG: hypothetical protein PHU59_00640 [Candidatus Omnitrophica bacterium]|nr:hypothetical protein [Candidatus Omnitrophota bacterium]